MCTYTRVCVCVCALVGVWGESVKVTVCFNSVPAAISESNLRKTFQFGGRRDPPTTAEIQTIVVSETIYS